MKDELDEVEYRIGRGDDKGFLRSISPLYKADKITKPLLIAHSKNDIRVSEKASSQIVEAMKKHQKPFVRSIALVMWYFQKHFLYQLMEKAKIKRKLLLEMSVKES